MKKSILLILSLALGFPSFVAAYSDAEYKLLDPAKMEWYHDAKFGLFVHWGDYSATGGYWSKDGTAKSRFEGAPSELAQVKGSPEWMMRLQPVAISEWKQVAEHFDWSKFNAQDFIKLCYATGQRYIVITSKHHDGFAMWRTKVSPYNICEATPYGRSSGRDPLKELAEACRATKGPGHPWEIKLCFYYSHDADWTEPKGGEFGYPLRKPPTAKEFDEYLNEKVKPQLKELLTQYGEVGLIWFDVPRNITDAQCADLKAFIHSLQPQTIINGRLGRGFGDYVSTNDNGIMGTRVDYPWETGSTLNDTWAYKLNTENWKTKEWLIERLIKIVSRGGNYLLNIGPKADGSFPQGAVAVLTSMGEWVKVHQEAIFGTKPTPYAKASMINHNWGYCTTRGNKLYLHVTYWPADKTVRVPLITNEVKSVHYLVDKNKESLPFMKGTDANGNPLISIQVPEQAPDKMDTIVVLETDGDVKLAPFKHAYDSKLKQLTLAAQNFQFHGIAFNLTYDPKRHVISGWANKNSRYDSAVWAVDIPESGTYKIQLNYGATNGGHEVEVKVNDQTLTTFRTVKTGKMSDYKMQDAGTIVLKAGQQELEIAPQVSRDRPEKKKKEVEEDDDSLPGVLQLKEVILTLEKAAS